MATSKVGTDRTPYQALEKYADACFLTDDKKLYFGNDGDVNLEYDEDGNDLLFLTGDTNIPHFITNTATAVAGGAGGLVIPVTHGIVAKTTGGVEALTLANGTDGQLLMVYLISDGGNGTITPVTKTGWATIVLGDAGDVAILQFINSTIGWVIVGLYGTAGPPAMTV